MKKIEKQTTKSLKVNCFYKKLKKQTPSKILINNDINGQEWRD